MASGITINSNLAAMNAQRRLGQSTQSVQQSFTRLSSGLRINKASDDAAGLAISTSLNTDQRVLNQGVRNISDGISALNIADGALETLSNIVIRLEELAEQSANGTLGKKQREAINNEAQALSEEYFRVSHSAAFNGIALLNGSAAGLDLQAGYGSGGTISVSCGGAVGTGSFNAASSFATGVEPFSITLGDLNGDGLQDVVAADYGSAGISVMLGNGDGSFCARTSFATGNQPMSIKLGDLNRDGVLDIVTADKAHDCASVLLGNGDGSFRSRTSFDSGTMPFSVTLGDLNGDDVLDLITADFFINQASVMLGNGDGSFRAHNYFKTGNSPFCVTTGDLNGDKVLDLIAADFASNTVSVMLGNGNGSFCARSSFATGFNPQSVAIGDLNGDGRLDLVTADNGSDRATIMLGNGDGSFRAGSSFHTSCPSSITLGDLNGDRILDLVTTEYFSDNASVMLGNGDGSFRSNFNCATGTEPSSVVLGDLNGDGVLDMAVGHYGSSQVSIFLALTDEGTPPLLAFDLSTISGARQALPVFSQKREQLSSQRGRVGAMEARLGVALNTLRVSAENYASAESRIRDADVAQESAQLLKNQILQQAGAAVLAQANQAPALALMLLRSG
jgi:flagellin-like hook-associated protein FlgL